MPRESTLTLEEIKNRKKLSVEAKKAAVPPVAPEVIQRAGLIPCIEHEGSRYYMVYRFKNSDDGKWMIAKGRRMTKDKNAPYGWRDITNDDFPIDKTNIETFEQTALREGKEKLGVKIPKDKELIKAGLCQHEIYDKEKQEHVKIPFMLFTVKLEDDLRNVYHGHIFDKETDGFWVTLSDFFQYGRLDHAAILQSLDMLIESGAI